MMSDKPKIRRDQIVSEDGQKLAYVDDGGTLRHTVKSKVEIVEAEAESGATETAEAATDSQAAAPETSSEPVVVPPSSDTPAPTPAAESAAKPPKSRKREKTTMATQTATAKKVPPTKAKTAAKKAPAKRVNGHAKTEGTGVRTIAGKVVDITHYEKTKAPGGGTSYHNGDSVAERLNGKTLDEAYGIAAKTLKLEEKELRKLYGHLNVGMQRMSLGNRMRKVLIPKPARA
jgi:hypothetical protein